MEGSKIIVDFDCFSYNHGLEVAEQLSGHVWGFRFGSVAYTTGFNPVSFSSYGKVMCDLNLYTDSGQMEDIVRMLVSSHVEIITVHGMANWEPKDADLCQYLAGVTILPTLSMEEVGNLYGYQLNPLIRKLASSIEENGYKYLICSGRDLKELVSPPLPQGLVKICQGVCPVPIEREGMVSPEDAIDFGADLLIFVPVVAEPDRLIGMVDKINKTVQDLEKKC